MDPVQSAEKLAEYPPGPDSVTSNAPAFRNTVVPGDSAPAKIPGEGADPCTPRVKSLATAVPPLLLITCLITISFG